MKRSPILLLFLLLLAVIPVGADDIDAYYPVEASGGIYLHVTMDLGNSSLDGTICTYGVDCAPPFMSEAAHRHLAGIYTEGAAVTAPGVFKAVLSAVLENTLFDELYLSLLISNHAENQSEVRDDRAGGGTILSGYRRLDAHRSALATTLKSIPILSSENAHQLQPKESYFEWLRYLRGGDIALGDNTAGNFGQSNPVPDYDGEIISNGRYLSPFSDSQACPKLYSILFTLGASAQDEDLNDLIAAELPLSGDNSFEQMLIHLHDGRARLLPETDTNIFLQKTWVVSSRDRPGNAVELAAIGGGGEVLYVDDPVELQARLTGALAAIAGVSGSSMDAVFAADVYRPGRVLDELFVPLFLPRGGFGGQGNLKKLKLKHSQISGESVLYDDSDILSHIVDVHGDPAFEEVGDDRGKLRFNALTFWTDVLTLPAGDGENIPHNTDGRVVARGGAGQKIDGFVPYVVPSGATVQHLIGDTNGDAPADGSLPRQLFYESPTGHELKPFDANAIALEALKPLLDPSGEVTDDYLLTLIKWARGQDTDNGKPTARDWLMGEVLHSRPATLNYGTTPGYSAENPNVRLFFGSGEGLFHILENTDTGGNEAGREVFGFYPRESLATIRSRYEGQAAGLPRHYGVDGAPVIFKQDRNGDGTLDYRAGDEAHVYFGLRRGGSRYFALDISNPDAVPSLLWEINATAGAEFEELGLTFSTPLVGKVNYSGEPVDVLVFAGGYDGGWNAAYTARRGKDLSADDDAMGNAIYIVNARTGELIWKAVKGIAGQNSNTQYAHPDLVDSIPSSVAALVTPTGIIHRLYVGDSGGAVWRIDLPLNRGGNEDHRKDHWFITQLADLGFDAAESSGAAPDDRRFFHAPDIVRSYDDIGDFDGVLIQSGNRADPNETQVENALFYIKDRHIKSGDAAMRALDDANASTARFHYADLPDQTYCELGTEAVIEGEDATTCGDRGLASGWKFRLLQPGEKGLSTPFTDGGRVFVSTFVPGATTACSWRAGQGQMHVLRLSNATAVANQQRSYELGPGIPAAAVPVGDAIFLPGGGIDLYDMDGDGERDTVKFLPSQTGKLYRTYWREPDVDPL